MAGRYFKIHFSGETAEPDVLGYFFIQFLILKYNKCTKSLLCFLMHLASSAFGKSSKGKANIAARPCPRAQLHLHHEIRNEVNIKSWSDINYNKHASSEQGQFFVFVVFFQPY